MAPQVPQLFDAPRSTSTPAAQAPAAVAGHVRRRATKRDRAITSFEMTFAERDRLDRLCGPGRRSIASVLRRGVVLVEEVDEALTPAELELLVQLRSNGTSLTDVVRRGLTTAAAEHNAQERAQAA